MNLSTKGLDRHSGYPVVAGLKWFEKGHLVAERQGEITLFVGKYQ